MYTQCEQVRSAGAYSLRGQARATPEVATHRHGVCGGDVLWAGRAYGDTTTLHLGEEDHMATACTHLDAIQDVTPSGSGCKECLEMGDTWVHLRICLSCGHVGCCDNSKNKHATKHFHTTQHPIIQSFQPDEDWRWCYIDEIYM